MPATTTLLGLVTPTQGTLPGTWGDTVNYGITEYLDIAIAGTLTLTGDGTVILANTTGSSSGTNITSTLSGAGTVTAQFAIVKVSGTTGVKIVQAPSFSRTYLVVNASSFAVTFKPSAAPGVSIAAGETASVYYNGTDYVKVVGTATAGAAGGSTTQVQYNNAGVLAGITGATSNGTVLTLVAPVLGAATATSLQGIIGNVTPAAGSFTTLGASSTATLNTLVSSGATLTGGTINGMTVGATTASTGAFTTLSATGVITSTVTSATITDAISGNTNAVYHHVKNTGGEFYLGLNNSSNAGLITGGGSYATCILNPSATNISFATDSQERLKILAAGGVQVTNTLSGGTSGTAYSFSGSAPANSLTLTSGGDLGIGVTSPSQKLELAGVLRVKNGNADTNGLNLSSDAAGVSTINSGYAGAGVLRFLTSDIEKMRITNAGDLYVGTTTGTIGTANFGVNVTQAGGIFASRNEDGTVAIFYFGGNAGGFRLLGNGNAENTNNSYGAISDVKLKENIVDATPKLADLMQVKVRNYNLIGDTTKQIGVVAQELETVFPSMIDVTLDKEAEGNDLGTTTKSVKYSVFVPMLIKAMQEQQALITQLTARITALETA